MMKPEFVDADKAEEGVFDNTWRRDRSKSMCG